MGDRQQQAVDGQQGRDIGEGYQIAVHPGHGLVEHGDLAAIAGVIKQPDLQLLQGGITELT